MTWPPTTHQDVQDRVGEITVPNYFRAGYYSLGAFGSTAFTSNTLALGTAYVRPFLVLATTTVDRIGVKVVTAATASSGGLIQCALYSNGAMPTTASTKVLETTAVSSETVGTKEWVISQTLTPGVWWLGVRSVTATCQALSFNNAAMTNPFISGWTDADLTSVSYGGYTASVTSGVAGFPTNGSSFTGWAAMMFLPTLRAA